MMESNPVQVTSVGQEVYRRLRGMITSGQLKPGAALTLRSIAEALSVSTTPVREALRMLEADGLVHYGRRSVTVSSLSVEEVGALFQIRLRLEQLAAEWAIEKMTDSDEQDIEEILDQLDANVDDQDRWRTLNQEFHRRFYDCADSAHLLEYIEKIWNSVEPYMAIYASSMSNFREANEEHRRMFEAIRARDLETLLVLTQHHLEVTCEQVVKELRKANLT
jgi:DNA-binding GntR family transcriptional regulator